MRRGYDVLPPEGLSTVNWCQVLLEALRQLVGQEHVHHLESLNWLIAIMLTVIAIKFMLFMYCR